MSTLPTLDSCDAPDSVRARVEHEDQIISNWHTTYAHALQLMSERINGQPMSDESILAYINAMLMPENRAQAVEA